MNKIPKKFVLLPPVISKSFSEYKGKAIRISGKKPATYDEVILCRADKPEKTRKVTTFRDSKGNIIERIFDFSNGKLVNQLYERQNSTINRNEKIKSVTIKRYSIDKKSVPFYQHYMKYFKNMFPPKTVNWDLNKVTTNHLSTNKITGEKILSQVKRTRINTPTKQEHSFIEFPHIINDKIEKKKKKILSFTVNGKTNKVTPGTVTTQKTYFPKNDSFLPLRAYTIKDSLEAFTNYFLKEKNLNPSLFKVYPDFHPCEEEKKIYAAFFDPCDGSVNFNKFIRPASKSEAAEVSRHEVEHCWQYFLNAIFNRPFTEWEKFINNKFSPKMFEKHREKAFLYSKSIANYIPLTAELEKAGQVEKYRENYIEKEAVKYATETEDKYYKEASCIHKQFPHIPYKFL